MLTKIKSLIMSLVIGGSLFVPMVPAVVMAVAPAEPEVDVSIENSLCAGASFSASAECNQDTVKASKGTVTSLIKTSINILSVIVGVVSVIMIIIGGLKYITSGGDATSITSAKNTILYALIGLVIVALAQIIVRFVLSEVGDATGP